MHAINRYCIYMSPRNYCWRFL